MISLDSSIIPAIVVFLVVLVALNKLLFKPLLAVQAEREDRTSGQMAQTRNQLVHCQELFDQYQAAVRKCRLEGYRRQEQVRAEALQKRTESLAQAKTNAEKMLQESCYSIEAQVQAAKEELNRAAREIADGIAASILRRTA